MYIELDHLGIVAWSTATAMKRKTFPIYTYDYHMYKYVPLMFLRHASITSLRNEARELRFFNIQGRAVYTDFLVDRINKCGSDQSLDGLAFLKEVYL